MEGLKHYGIWNATHSVWMMSGEGAILWSTSRAVMEAQLAYLNRSADKGIYEIREFIETGE